MSEGQYRQTGRDLASKVEIGDNTSIESLLNPILGYRVITDATWGGGGGGGGGEPLYQYRNP